MADLTKAMQTAAETTREETLARLQADAKAHVESIHTRSASEAEELRHTADADIAAIREWSKAEIARIREETDQKVVDRKATLEFEIEEHAARIEQRIERVQNHVALFENEMATFFERLLNEEDPTQLAAMAESLPEPPSFDDLGDLPAAAAPAAVATPVEADAVADALVAEPAERPPRASRSRRPRSTPPIATETDAVAEHGEATVDAPAEDPEAAFAARAVTCTADGQQQCLIAPHADGNTTTHHLRQLLGEARRHFRCMRVYRVTLVVALHRSPGHGGDVGRLAAADRFRLP